MQPTRDDAAVCGIAGMPAVRLQSPQLDGTRGSARAPERAYSPLFPPINFLPNPNITPNLHMAPYLNLPPAANQPPHLEGYNSVSPPLVYNLDGGRSAYAQYLPYARDALETGQIKMNGIQQFVGRGIRDGQGPWGMPEKQLPAVQYLKKQDSGLSHAGSGGSATLNNPVHKVPKVHPPTRNPLSRRSTKLYKLQACRRRLCPPCMRTCWFAAWGSVLELRGFAMYSVHGQTILTVQRVPFMGVLHRCLQAGVAACVQPRVKPAL